MSRASGCLWLIVGVILALVAGGLAYITLQRSTVSRATGEVAPSVSVVVAARPIPAGTVITEADLVVQTFPADLLPTGVISNTTSAAGMVAMVPLDTGEVLLAHHLTQPDVTVQNLGFTLPEGRVAIAIPAEDLLSRGQLIEAGNRVDIFYTLETSEKTGTGEGSNDKKQYTFGTLQGVVVVGVLRSTAGEQKGGGSTSGGSLLGGEKVIPGLGVPYAYILALDSQDALVLKYLQDAGAIMDVALRNIADETEHPVQPVDLPYVIDKYQLPAR
jgi:pilus assembly protein CpaB